MCSITLPEKIGADEYRDVEEVQKGPLAGHEKECNSGYGNKEEDNDQFLVDPEIFPYFGLSPHFLPSLPFCIYSVKNP